MTVRSVYVGLMLTAAMALAIPAAHSASAGENTSQCTCAKPMIHARQRSEPRHRAWRPRGQAYAERFYNYWSATPVNMTGWHGEWRQAPDDWVAPGDDGYAPGPVASGPPPDGYDQEAGLHIDRRGWSGGVGNFDGGGGGGGGMGQAIIAQGGGGMNGPTYNDYGQSFQRNPSQAGPFQSRQMGGLAPPPSSSSGSGSSSGAGSN